MAYAGLVQSQLCWSRRSLLSQPGEVTLPFLPPNANPRHLVNQILQCHMQIFLLRLTRCQPWQVRNE